MRIDSLYVPRLHSCGPNDTLADAATSMLRSEIGALAVVDDGALVGIISERDLARAAADAVDPAATRVSAYATSTVTLAAIDEDSAAVTERMLELGIRHMPVVSRGQLVGMVSMRDLLAVHAWM